MIEARILRFVGGPTDRFVVARIAPAQPVVAVPPALHQAPF